MFCIHKHYIFNLQLAWTDIMARTVHVLVRHTAGLVNPLTVHVVVMLVGWGLTVV